MTDPFDKNKFTEFMQKKEVIFLRELEKCRDCKNVFMSLYPLDRCGDHEALEAIR